MKKIIFRVACVLVFICANLAYLYFILFVTGFGGGYSTYTEKSEEINESLNQEDLNKLDLSDYKVLDYLKEEKDSKKYIVYRNAKLSDVYYSCLTDSINEDNIYDLIDYSSHYFYDKFGLSVDIYRKRFQEYDYNLDVASITSGVVEDDNRIVFKKLYHTNRKITCTNVDLDFYVWISYDKNDKKFCIKLDYDQQYNILY